MGPSGEELLVFTANRNGVLTLENLLLATIGRLIGASNSSSSLLLVTVTCFCSSWINLSLLCLPPQFLFAMGQCKSWKHACVSRMMSHSIWLRRK